MRLSKLRSIGTYLVADHSKASFLTAGTALCAGIALLSLGLLLAPSHAQAEVAALPTKPLRAKSESSRLLSSAAAIDACLSAISDSERKYHIPAGLLLAIARTESGRLDPRTGMVQPWPWTLDVEGVGFYLQSAGEAVQRASDSRQRGANSIDTGCLQVNLQQHPDAFKTLNDAFEPRSNVDYAARFLAQLHGETGDWIRASCFYHSHTPELAIPYLRRVKAHFAVAEPQIDARIEGQSLMVNALKAAWNATLPKETPAQADSWIQSYTVGSGGDSGLESGKTYAAAAQPLPGSRNQPRASPNFANLTNGLLTGHCV